MAVDLSMAGLQGQQAYADRMATLAQADVSKANAQETQLKTETAQRMQAIADDAAATLPRVLKREQAPGDPLDGVDAENLPDNASVMDHYAQKFAAAGFPEMAKDLAVAGGNIRKQEDEIKSAEITRQQNKLENVIKLSQIAGQFFGAARNQAEWDMAVDRLEQGGLEPEYVEQMRAQPFDEEVAQYYAETAMTAHERARLDLEGLKFDQQSQKDSISAQQAQTRIDLQRARDAVDAQHKAHLQKAGGKPATAPTDNQLDIVRAELRSTLYRNVDPKAFKKGKEDPDFTSAVSYIASTAMQMVNEVDGISFDTAVRRATIQAEQNGTIVRDPGKVVTIKTAGLTPENAITATPGTPKSGFVRGKYYKLPDGRVGRFTGDAFLED